MRWPLLGGAYMAQGLIANAQRCVNLYPERNPQDSPVPITHYPTPGLRLVVAGLGVGRGVYAASDGTLYGVSGTTLWWRSSAGVQTLLGTISNLQTPVQFVDNGTTLVVVDGTSTGAWTVDLISKTFALYTDPAGLFAGATMGVYVDTFMLFNVPGTRRFVSTLSNVLEFDPTYEVSKSGAPDPLVGVAVAHREIWVIGTQTSEIFATVADQDFPFQQLPGTFVEYGCAAPYSIATADVSVFWLSQNKEGARIVVRGKGYAVERVSNHAMEYEFSKYSTVEDAVAYSYQENGHIFYVLSFPTADKTWVFDESTGVWHERAWMDENGSLHRHRVAFACYAYGKQWGMDWESGALFEMSTQLFDDAGWPIVCVRSFPHMLPHRDGQGMTDLSGKRFKFHKFMLDVQTGTMPETTPEVRQMTISPALLQEMDDEVLSDPDGYDILLDNAPGGPLGPRVMLRWSNTRGASWEGYRVQTLGAAGQIVYPMWRRLGMARDRVWEVSWVANCPIALNGAWVELQVMRT